MSEPEATPQDILMQGPDAMLAYVLHELPESEEARYQFGNKLYTDDKVEAFADYAWTGDTSSKTATNILESAVERPRFVADLQPVNFPDKSSFTEALKHEARSRNDQRVFLDRFDSLIESATSSDDFVKLVDVFGFIREHVVGDSRVTRRATPESLFYKFRTSVADQLSDNHGFIDPRLIEQKLTPAAEALLEQEKALHPDVEAKEAELEFGKSIVVSSTGTAEYVASYLIRDVMRKNGRSGIAGSGKAFERTAYVGQEFPTQRTIDRLKKDGYNPNATKKTIQLDNAQHKADIVINAMNTQAGKSAQAALRKIRSTDDDPFNVATPIMGMLNLAAVFTDQANQHLGGDYEHINGNGAENLFRALDRVLAIADPDLRVNILLQPLDEMDEVASAYLFARVATMNWLSNTK